MDMDVDVELCRNFVLNSKVRISAICLKRRVERWTRCQEHMGSVLREIHDTIGHELEFHMFEGVDGTAPNADGDPTIDGLERAHGFTLFRDWAVTDPEDLERVDPSLLRALEAELGAPGRLTPAQLNEPAAYVRLWRAYEGLYTRHGWRRERARHYTDFHNRHITAGEVRAGRNRATGARGRAAPMKRRSARSRGGRACLAPRGPLAAAAAAAAAARGGRLQSACASAHISSARP